MEPTAIAICVAFLSGYGSAFSFSGGLRTVERKTGRGLPHASSREGTVQQAREHCEHCCATFGTSGQRR
jgi:hypothetical protein